MFGSNNNNLFGVSSSPSTSSFRSTPFGNSIPSAAQTGSSIFGGTSAGLFGQSSIAAFGASSSPLFGSSTPAFGVTSTPAFGSTSSSFSSSTFGVSSTPAFGSTTSSAFGTLGASLFGATSTPTFDASCTPAFGASSTPAFGGSSSFSFSSTPAFGQAASTFGSTPFGSTPSPFGALYSPFGAQTTTPAFGNPAFGQTCLGTPQVGTRVVPYSATQETDAGGTILPGKLESISAMHTYIGKSYEELRWEDYQRGDKGVVNEPLAFGSSPSLFGSASGTTSTFNSGLNFGDTQTSGLFQSSSSSPGQSISPFGSFHMLGIAGTGFKHTPSAFGSAQSTGLVRSLFSSSASMFSTSNPSGLGQTTPSVSTPFQSAPAQSSDAFSFSNFGQTQEAPSTGFGGTSNIFNPGTFGHGASSQPNMVVQPTPITNPTATTPGFMFGSPAPPQQNPVPSFSFGGVQNPPAQQNASPFQPGGGVDFNLGGNFSLESGGGDDKSARKFIKVKRGFRRRK